MRRIIKDLFTEMTVISNNLQFNELVTNELAHYAWLA